MAVQRSMQRSPSTGGLKSNNSSNITVSSSTTAPPLSANTVGVYNCEQYYKSTTATFYGGGPGMGNRNRTRRRPHPAAMVPGSDARQAVTGHARIGGFEDPSYAAPSADTSKGDTSSKSSNATSIVPISVAVILWYFLGVVSIASSKILLSTHNVPPLVLTMQQLIIGMTLLRTLLEMQTSGEKDKDRQQCRGLQPIPIQGGGAANVGTSSSCPEKGEAGMRRSKSSNDVVDLKGNSSKVGLISSILALVKPSSPSHIHTQLFLAAIFFALGFLLTNCGFQSGSAAFVETVKAAEPFTSASVAVLWGIEHLGKEEVSSLTGIVAGVVLSTLGHRGSAKPTASDALDIPSQSLATKCIVVMLSNLCFSFRGLHQKLFRSTPQGKASVMDDLNLQYRMQQIGVLMLIIPTIFGNTFWALNKLQHASFGGSAVEYALQYVLLSIINGLAFTSYNLASTFVLTRISVVHHAALNCIRRVFAIIVTSIIFGLKITGLQIFGIALAVAGFFSYIHFKMKKETKEKRRNELRKKWGGIMIDAKSGKWTGKSSSILPVSYNGRDV